MRIVLDIETNSTASHIWLAVARDIDNDRVVRFTGKDALQDHINRAEKVIMHNGIGFDGPVLKKLWGVTMKKKQVVDTLVLSRLYNPQLEGGHSLASWGQRLGFPKGDFTDFDGGLTPEMIQYCEQDTLVTKQLYLFLEREMKHDYSQQSIDLEHEVAIIVAEQERNGFKLDEREAIGLLTELKDKLSNIENELQSVFPTKTVERYSEKTGKRLKDEVIVFNPGSRKQIAERLIEKGWKPTKTTEKGSIIVDETTLEGVDIPEAKKIAEYLMLQKRIAQIESWIDAVESDGRVHGKVITNGAISGRATHHSPNMAQVPNIDSVYGKECRALWTVDEGNALVGVDLAQLELRCLAHYMKDDDYTNTLLSGDIHEKNRQAAGLSTRGEAKRFGFAFLYGAGGKKIGEILGCSASQGQAVIDRYLKAMPKLKKLREKVERMSAQGSIPGLDGRRLNIRSSHSAVNTLLQGAGAIVSKQWIVETTKAARAAKIPYRLVAWVHDEIQLETPQAYAEQLGKIAVEAARTAGVVLKTRCPMDAEYSIGTNWSESH